MGRRSKPPVEISSAVDKTTEVACHDELPVLVNYLDVPFSRATEDFLTRIFLITPTQEEIDDTVAMKERMQKNFSVLCARMPFMPSGFAVSSALYDHCLENGFSKDFAKTLLRLVINDIQGRRISSDALSSKTRSYRRLVTFIADYMNEPSLITMEHFDKRFWLAYADSIEVESSKGKYRWFCDARVIFAKYPPTSLRGWLNNVTFGTRSRSPSSEHTSELADSGYSDRVMYQILALCIEGFQRRLGYLKRYESLSEADMPSDWFYPGRDTFKPAYGVKLGRVNKGEVRVTEVFVLLSNLLNDEESGYQILIDHFLMHHKAGVIRKHEAGKYWVGGVATTLAGYLIGKKLVPQIKRFYETTAILHGFTYKRGSNCSLLSFYLKKESSTESNIVQNQIAWCLVNLFIMQTGVNKEVALSIPSTSENGKSILLRPNSIFISRDRDATEIELYGYKERSGTHTRKVIPIPIVKESPLYQMLCDYEQYVKVDSSGPFFEIDRHFSDNWGRAGGLKEFSTIYPILDDQGNTLSSVMTPKFRKVFASRQLLDRIKGIKDPNDLAEKLREDLSHGSLDTTLSHYLLKTNVGRSVIDIAIATITNEKLAEALRFKGKISLGNEAQIKKKVFLCDCEDPSNPSHDVAIAAECKHYDLCLGCERSVVTQFHLPYICLRILQYEKARRADPHIWPAIFEDRWNIANDALDQYVAKDRRNGQRLIEEAWVSAREGRISLPPIINSSRM